MQIISRDKILHLALSTASVCPPVFIATAMFQSVTEQLWICISVALFSVLSNFIWFILLAMLVMRPVNATALSWLL